MGKRKSGFLSEEPKEISRVEIIMGDLSTHPRCPHGPTLLFSGVRGQFYACSCCRNGECSVRITPENWSDPRMVQKNKKFLHVAAADMLDKKVAWRIHQKLCRSGECGEVSYCASCDVLCAPPPGEHAAHTIVAVPRPTAAALRSPSTWLPPLSRDTREAQYIFTQEAISTILNLLRANNIKRVVCVGAPSVYEALQGAGAASLLLDMDQRYRHFVPPQHFLPYNMFNHHFFNGIDDQIIFDNFLKLSRAGEICVVMDPPFGGRVEPLAHTLKLMSARWAELGSGRNLDGELLPVVWAFPYFAEPHITNLLPSLRMHDYQVTYKNHLKWRNESKRSPVRLFTNLPLSSLELAHNPQYKHCAPCDKWVHRSNSHCARCGACTGKNAAPYKHCDACARCVKATYTHCVACGRCVLPQSHRCGLTLPMQSCYHCRGRGHKRADCPLLGGTHKHNTKRK